MDTNLGRFIRLQDFKTKELTGTTASSADTQSLFRHGSGAVPMFWLPVEGEVYCPRQGLGPNTIDLRSRLASQAFRILLFFGS